MGTSDNLQARPVRRAGNPVYPTKIEVLSDPLLLEQHVPIAWLSRKEVARALAVLLAAGVAGCGGGATVAPVFRHGDGRGTTGCVVANPPAFLSEEEALQVVREELSETGLRFTESEVEIPSVKIPRRTLHYSRRAFFRKAFFAEDAGEEPFTIVTGPEEPLSIDLRDPEKRVAIEFVSLEDYEPLGGIGELGSFQVFDIPQVVNFASGYVREKGPKDAYVCFLYDPLAEVEVGSRRDSESGEEYWDRRNAEFRKESIRLLREQVKDFAEWLKAQGVI